MTLRIECWVAWLVGSATVSAGCLLPPEEVKPLAELRLTGAKVELSYLRRDGLVRPYRMQVWLRNEHLFRSCPVGDADLRAVLRTSEGEVEGEVYPGSGASTWSPSGPSCSAPSVDFDGFGLAGVRHATDVEVELFDSRSSLRLSLPDIFDAYEPRLVGGPDQTVRRGDVIQFRPADDSGPIEWRPQTPFFSTSSNGGRESPSWEISGDTFTMEVPMALPASAGGYTVSLAARVAPSLGTCGGDLECEMEHHPFTFEQRVPIVP